MLNVRRPLVLFAAVCAAAPAALPSAAQELPLVSRQLQFHAAPAGGVGGFGPNVYAPETQPGTTRVPVVIANIPRVPLPPGAEILPQRVNPQTGLYVDNFTEAGVPVIPDTPAQLPEEAMPRLVVGQVYLPPWWDEVRNVRGGLGPADPGPADRGVQPEDLQIAPPPPAPGAEGDEGLPQEAPAAPSRVEPRQGSAVPRAPAPAAAPAAPPAAGEAAPAPAAAPQPVPQQPVPQQPVPQQPVPQQPEPVQRAAPAAAGGEAGGAPIPLVSRKLNFRY